MCQFGHASAVVVGTGLCVKFELGYTNKLKLTEQYFRPINSVAAACALYTVNI